MAKKASQKILREPPTSNCGFIRLPQVLALYPVGKSTWWAGVKDGRFPKAVKLGPRTTAWRVEDIQALIAKTNEGGGAV